MIIRGRKSFWVFDLDDTLYKEVDFLRSGLASVANVIKKLYGKDISSDIWEWHKNSEKDIFLKMCQALNLTIETKESLLWHYRLHEPNISLAAEVEELLRWLNLNTKGIAILTDGRSLTQKAKLLQLGLGHVPAYISEEFASEKPELLRFELIMAAYPADSYIYVGDNPKKDFFAPKRLGWKTIGLIADDRNIHLQDLGCLSEDYLPHLWIKKLSQIKSFIC